MGTKYSTVTVSGYNSSPPADDGTQVASNQVKWSTIKTKLPDPLKTALESVNTNLVTWSDFGSRQVSSADTTTAADHMKTVEIGPTVSTSITVSLGDAATMAAGYIVGVFNSSPNAQTVGRITAGDKINGVAQNLTLPSKCGLVFKVANTASEGYFIIAQFGGVFYDKTDPRKAIVFSASNVSSGSTRQVNWGNADVTFPSTAGTVALTSEFAYQNLDSTSGRLQFPPKWIEGLVPSAPQNSTIALTVGSCRDVSDTANMILSSAITKAISATWTVGTGNGGLDTGTVTNTSWYYVHLIKRSDTGVVDALLSLSATAPTMPANYDKRRLVGAARTDSSGTFSSFSAMEMAGGGLEFLWAAPVEDVADTSVTSGANTRTLASIPNQFITTALVNATVQASTSSGRIYLSSPAVNDVAPTVTGGTPGSTIGYASSSAISGISALSRVRSNSSGQIRTRAAGTGAVSLWISTLGWEWSRR